MTFVLISSNMKYYLFLIFTIVEVKSIYPGCEGILDESLIKEIQSYSTARDNIFKYVLEGEFKGRTYKELAKFINKFGARPSGSYVLEQSIDYMVNLTREANIDDIVTENVKVPHWIRKMENLEMLKPRLKDMALIGLGRSVSTSPEGITAEVLVVDSFSEFDKLTVEQVKGKIVLFNAPFVDYFETVVYRYQAATKAATKGGVASLVRSITPFSINSPHTGLQSYGENVTKIPTAAITLEDANLLKRLYQEGEKIIVNIKMFSETKYNISRNTLADLKGTESPEKLVIVSGHVDSWDIAEGAMDDGGGLFVSWAAPVILKKINLKPRQTVRAIYWTSEEQGYVGAYAYEKLHRNDSQNINFIMESDEGTFSPLGLKVAGNKKARCIIAEVLKLFESINATTLVESDTPGTDIDVIITKLKVPGASLLNDNGKYWWFHHTAGDTLDVEDEHELDLCTAFWTTLAYIIADISIDIPR